MQAKREERFATLCCSSTCNFNTSFTEESQPCVLSHFFIHILLSGAAPLLAVSDDFLKVRIEAQVVILSWKRAAVMDDPTINISVLHRQKKVISRTCVLQAFFTVKSMTSRPNLSLKDKLLGQVRQEFHVSWSHTTCDFNIPPVISKRRWNKHSSLRKSFIMLSKLHDMQKTSKLNSNQEKNMKKFYVVRHGASVHRQAKRSL